MIFMYETGQIQWTFSQHCGYWWPDALAPGPRLNIKPSYLRMAISMLKIRRPLGRLIFNMGIAIPGKTVFLIATAPRISVVTVLGMYRGYHDVSGLIGLSRDTLQSVTCHFHHLNNLEIRVGVRLQTAVTIIYDHDDTMAWKPFPNYWPYVGNPPSRVG